MKKNDLEKRFKEGRMLERIGSGVLPSKLGVTGDEEFSLIELLSGTWTSRERGWNLIALPASAPKQFRILMNQYDEELNFNNTADKNVPNRGVKPEINGKSDQLIDAIDYEQIIVQKGWMIFLRAINAKRMETQFITSQVFLCKC